MEENKGQVFIKVYPFVDASSVYSRFAGEKIREAVLKAIKEGNRVVLDFEGINFIGNSFADELVGVLVRAFGIEFVKENLSVVNAKENVKQVLNAVANYSKKKRPM